MIADMVNNIESNMTVSVSGDFAGSSSRSWKCDSRYCYAQTVIPATLV